MIAPVFTHETRSPEGTVEAGRQLGAALMDAMVVALSGRLGAGKTHLVKGIALGNGLGDAGRVTSPTFSLVNEYPGRLHLYHMDAYRLGDADSLESLGFDECLRPGAVVVVEWPERVRDGLPDDVLWITMETTGETVRRLVVHASGDRSRQCAEAWRDRLDRASST